MSDQTKMAVLGSAAIIIALLLWVYFCSSINGEPTIRVGLCAKIQIGLNAT